MRFRPCAAPTRHGAALKDLVWFRAGGPAEVLFRPADAEDLATFLAAKPADMSVSVIGVGSNLLVRDGGIPGVGDPPARRLRQVSASMATRIVAGAAALDAACRAHGRGCRHRRT